MSVTSSSESSALGETTESPKPDAAAPEQRPRLNQPVRAVIAVVELILAAVAVWLAFRLWPYGITTIDMPISEGKELTLTRYHGDVIAAAIALGALASLFVLDAGRQCVLALRARPVRAKRGERARDDDVAVQSSGSSSSATA